MEENLQKMEKKQKQLKLQFPKSTNTLQLIFNNLKITLMSMDTKRYNLILTDQSKGRPCVGPSKDGSVATANKSMERSEMVTKGPEARTKN